MHNTLEEFYNYLAETFVGFFHHPGKLVAGERYSLFFEKNEDLSSFKQALISLRPALVEEFSYRHKKSAESYTCQYLKLGDIDLLIASDKGATENYLTTLRNLVSAQKEPFKNKAILILFSGKLDSLIGGSGDLTKSGFPFNYEQFSSELKEKIRTSITLKRFEREILLDNLKTRSIELRLENASVFDLSTVVGIYNRGGISINDFAHLGLFPHDDLKDMTSAEIEGNLKENLDYFASIESTINYGNLSTDLEKRLNSAGARMVASAVEDDAWKIIDFSAIWNARNKKERAEPIAFIDIDRERLVPGIEAWDVPLNGTKAGKRIQSIIVFNTSGKTDYQLFLTFNLSLKGTVEVLSGTDADTKADISKKSIRLSITAEHYNEDFLDIAYTDVNETTEFRFRIWAINTDSGFMKSFKNAFRILEDGTASLNSLDKIVFNPGGTEPTIETIFDGETVSLDDGALQINFDANEENEEVAFLLSYGHYLLKYKGIKKAKTPGLIHGWEVWQDKRVHKKHFEYEFDELRETLKLKFKGGQYIVKDEFQKNLLLERQMIDLGGQAWNLSEDLSLSVIPLQLSPELNTAYQLYHQALKSLDSVLPSLAYLDDELRLLAENYVETFLAELDSIPEESALATARHADLLKLGSLFDLKSAQLAFGPLHPLNVAFQLEANAQLAESILYEAMLKKINPTNLIPYLYWQKGPGESEQLYSSTENGHSPEWIYYTDESISYQSSGKDYVRRLVMKKLGEFVENFEYLFSLDNRAPIKINVFHMGDCSQVLQGIFDYYKAQVSKKVNPKDLRPIDLHIDGSDQYVTMFEKMAHLYNTTDIEEELGLSSNFKNYSLDDLLDAFRTNVRFFAYGYQDEVKYAHLSFYKLNNGKNKKTRRAQHQLTSGLSLGGLISDLSSNAVEEQYITGFGNRFHASGNVLARMAELCNAVAVVNFKTDPFRRSESICTTMDQSLKGSLDKLYSRSQWVTFVDPHFDHSFFREEDDIIIVHYSDQYSNASGIDAITVTRKSNQYEYLLSELLAKKETFAKPGEIAKLIDLYNAVNGEWLLKLIGKKDTTIQMEKLSIPSAIKGFLALYAHPEVIWVPLSLEEILRVSSGAGLDKSSGLFSTKNLGSAKEHSDDILMVGLFEIDGKLHVQLLPLEVKIGEVNSKTINEAHTQVRKTYDLLEKHLRGAELNFRQTFYRNFFAKLTLISTSKMDFYKIWPAQQWKKVYRDYRERLMANDFELTDLLVPYTGKYAIMAFSESDFARSITFQQELMTLNMLGSDGYGWLIRDIDELISWIRKEKHTINTELLFYKQLPELTDIPLEEVGELDLAEKKKAPDVPVEKPHTPEVSPERQVAKPLQASGEVSICFGEELNYGTKVNWNPGNTSKVMHTNTGIIGTMGTGKTQFTKSVVTQLSQSAANNVEGKPIGILIFDYKGDYLDDAFTQATGAKIYQLYNLPYNPLAIDVSENSMPLLPLHIASTLQETISNAFNLGNKQKALLKETIMEAYAEKGIYKNKPETWTKTAPTISDVCEHYLGNEKVAVDSLHAALNQLHDFEIFQPDGTKTQSLYELISGVTVIKLSGYSPDIQNLVVAITLDAFYSQMQKNGHSKIKGNYRQLSKMILVDEADNFLSKNFLSLRKILKEGREFGVGTILSTQFLNHFSTGENVYEQYILTWIIHRVSDVKVKDIDTLFAIKDKDKKEKLIQTIKDLQKHQSLVSLGGSMPVIIEDLPFYKLIDQKPNVL